MAGIVAGAMACPKVSYASEKATVVKLDRPGFRGRWDGYDALLSPSRAAAGLLVDEEGKRT
ncbi:MAG TPA: hypothetical protein VGI68_05865 [Mycobacterium sp.]|jgi:hypothetical protein